MLPLVPLVFLGGLIGPMAGQAARGKKKIGIASASRGGLAQFFLLFFGLFVVWLPEAKKNWA